jgi:magnesium-transporting ATPase (P-type)
MFNSVEKPQAIWKRKLRQAGRELHRWNRNLIYSLIEIIILCAATTVIFIAVVSFLKAMWHLYLQTPVGRKFVSDASLVANPTLAELLSKDLILFSVEVTATTLIAGLIIAAICQVLAVRRIFYEGRGLANRIMWVLLFITVSAHILTDRSQIDFPIAIWLSVLPSLCMFATCLTVCARLLPELTPIGILEMTRRFRSFVTSPE